MRYIVLDRPMAEKLRTADWRAAELLEKHAKLFRETLPDILAGDHLPNVTVHDLRKRSPQ